MAELKRLKMLDSAGDPKMAVRRERTLIQVFAEYRRELAQARTPTPPTPLLLNTHLTRITHIFPPLSAVELAGL